MLCRTASIDPDFLAAGLTVREFLNCWIHHCRNLGNTIQVETTSVIAEQARQQTSRDSSSLELPRPLPKLPRLLEPTLPWAGALTPCR